MNASTMKAKNHWKNVGRRCKAMGWAIEVVLTGREGIDAWIRAGYEGAK
jgi:hypothetical protein